MFNVIIADDEPAIRNGLVNFIDWTSLDCKIIAEASNGSETIDLFKEASPDILITDIKMPGISGIELAKYVHENYPRTAIIILTGFADFEYAQFALQYGVKEFLLKPTSKESISEAILKVSQELIKARNYERKINHFTSKLNDSLDERRRCFLQNLSLGIIPSHSDLVAALSDLQLNLCCYGIVAVEIGSISVLENPFSPERNSDMFSSMQNMLEMIFQKQRHIVFVGQKNTLCVLLDFNEHNAPSNMQYILDSCQEILQMINIFSDILINITVSGIHNNNTELPVVFNEINTAFNNQFYGDSNISIFTEGIMASTKYNLFTEDFAEQIIKYVRQGNSTAAVEATKAIFRHQKKARLPIQHCQNISIQLCSLCAFLLCERGTTLDDVVKETENIYQNLLMCKNIRQLSNLTCSVLFDVSCFFKKSSNNSNIIIQKTIEYINKNYSKKLTLQSIAENVHINSSYLSRLFRQKTGTTLTNFISEIRLERAKELILQSEDKTYEIASLVGIEDPAYFSQIFKKHTGYSPTEFRVRFCQPTSQSLNQ